MPQRLTAISYDSVLSAGYLAAIDEILAGSGAGLGRAQHRQEDGFQVRVLPVDYDGGAPALRAKLAAELPAELTNQGPPGRTDEALADPAHPDPAHPGPAHPDPHGGAYTTIVPEELRQATRKLLILDVDSTLIEQEVIELLAAHAGREAEVAAVTEAAMRGELDFAQSLHARVATLAGLPASVLEDVRAAVRLTPGARQLLGAFNRAGHVTAVVSGGFSQILDPLSADLGLRYAQANQLEVADGLLTGRVIGAVTDRAAKAAALQRWAAAEDIPLEHTIAIGDGANDLDMLAAAGLGVAFNAKPALRRAADAQINLPTLAVAASLAGVTL